MARFEVPEGWTVQAFRFTLDPTEDQSWILARHFGARRKAYNWTVATLKADIEAWDTTGVATAKPSLHACGHVQDIGWAEHWQCHRCSASHQRDDNAAINLARYEEPVSVVGPVGAAVKRGADRKTGPRPAGGREARKGRSQRAAEQPRDGVQVA
jgi:transposase